MPLLRRLLRALFRSLQLAGCYALLGAGRLISTVSDKGNYLRWLVLGSVAMRKVASGALRKATRLAKELLVLSEVYKDDWNYGNAVHKGNLVLGRVALREGDLESAKVHLLRAGATPGSPQLCSFGPNMSLAKELLEAGETEAVLEYFELCHEFWEMESGHLKWWADIVRRGQMPNFGPNLSY